MTNAFIITVDTEGDNLWRWKKGAPITTENAKFIPRFQELCEKFGCKPVYLTNYEMAQDDAWVHYIKPKAQQGLCEIGMHIHAWNSPPEYKLKDFFGGNPYITEYPDEVAEEKIKYLTHFLESRFETKIVSARSGRWATNDAYFDALKRNGYGVDCSLTPDIDWSANPGATVRCGNDYRNVKRKVFLHSSGIVEVPMTSKKVRHWAEGTVRHKVASITKGDKLWLRPFKKSLHDLIFLSENVAKEENGYLEFMIHSSELMPGGSPYFKSEEEIDLLYMIMRQYFGWVSENDYEGVSLSDYVDDWNKKNV